MTAHETITLTDLARLAEVGRNAVSNWRRREPDFPTPVDESARRPRFDLAQIEHWAAQHGRELHITTADRIWFSLHGTHPSPDHALRAVAAALDGDGSELAKRLEEATAETDPAELFEFFVERARETTGTATPGIGALVDIGAVCAPSGPGLAVHDPACGEGDLLTALVRTVPETASVSGRDLSSTQAAICERRLRLRRPGADIAVHIGDSLLSPLPEERYDLVVCDPPFNIKDWGHERLPTGDDPRLAYGTPPRTEPELAWALHCLSLLAPGGVAVVRMPAMVAHRRSGRRIRSELLRWGALRAVIDHPDSKAHIWVLVPRGESSQLLVSTGGDFARTWHDFNARPGAAIRTADSVTVPLMRLWDEDVDISPAVYLASADTGLDDLSGATERLGRTLAELAAPLPRFGPSRSHPTPETSLADLERDGLIEIGPGGAEGDGVVVDPIGPRTVRLGPLDSASDSQWTISCATDAVDPAWLAAVLTARLPSAAKRTATGAKRRILAVKLPRLPLAEQRRRGAAFAELLHLRDRLETAGAEAAALAGDVATGLVTGAITVDDEGDGESGEVES
ncbi:N-6 DNA methylase [Glycomyces xiaoerkulensis]|uniref:N-6 DNA methylase n=1 Tax=Glycomyces xiaoerkulensis TaxID=2038139 RepID=UPI000C266675|nr:N-6 DNA methylase [Glycomyces xiaoerkulensis]